MSILSSIKEERKLSFNHWRYRLLHWAFNVKNPDPKNYHATGLPPFLYTHYCPLFHLTNLIAIVSPLILLIKLLVVFFCAIGAGFVYVFQKIDFTPFFEFLASLNRYNRTPKEYVPPPPPTKEQETGIFVQILSEYSGTFESFWGSWSCKFATLTEDDARAVYNEYYPKIEEARERYRLRKQRLRESLIFWTNFSRVFNKWTLNIFYGVLALSLLYLTFLAIEPVYEGVCAVGRFFGWLFTDAVSLDAVFVAMKVAFALSVLTGLGFLGLWFGVFDKVAGALRTGLVKVTAPLSIFGVFGSWVSKSFNSVCEFVSMFYEENCPPITIVSEPEGVVEAVARGEEETIK